jgi:glycine cleavage system H protein
MSYPAELKYTKDHEWIKIEGKQGTVGVTKYAIEQLGDVVYLDLPKVGAAFKAHETFGTIESTKTVSDLYMPVSAVVKETNQAVVDTPENLATDCYENGWLLKIELEDATSDLLTASEYEDYIRNH